MKRSRTATLVLMSAAPLMLTACGSDEAISEGLYTSVEACVEQTNDRYNCQEAFSQATAQAEVAAPKYATREECIAAHGEAQCEQRSSGGSSFFMPMMTGFLLGQMLRGGQAAGPAAGSPAFRDRAGNWQRPAPGAGGGVYRPGAAPTAMAPVNAQPNKAPTTSRGGFGSSSSSRNSSGS